MVVIRLFLSISVLLLASSTYCQTKRISINANDKSIPAILKLVEAESGFYFSYDPDLFKDEAKHSLAVRQVMLQDALHELLNPKYNFIVVGEFIVITSAKAKLTKDPSAKSEKEKGKPLKPLIYTDTVLVKKIIHLYDTQRIIQRIQLVDTTYMRVNRIVYDTLKVQTGLTSQREVVPYITSINWSLQSSTGKPSSYAGIGVGAFLIFGFSHFKLLTDIRYSYLFSNFVYNEFDSSGLSTDSTKVLLVSERINQLSYLSVYAGISTKKQFGKLSIGIEGGASIYYLINADEKNILNDGKVRSLNKSDYSKYLLNLQLSIPLAFKLSTSNSFILTPWVEYGLNSETLVGIISRTRQLYGLKLGLSFR
jgi:hypothetical protein